MIDTICIILKDLFGDYIEGDLVSGFNRAIEEHIKHCESCRKLYENELKITTMFKKAFYVNDMKFISCRTDVMKKINPQRYKKGFVNNLRFRLGRLNCFFS